MDIESTIQSIVRIQAKAEARVNAMEQRLDRRMDAIIKLLQQGMRMLVKTDTTLAAVAERQERLAEAQKATDRTLKAFINRLRSGRNGR